MLTATQVETVALITDGGIICLDCGTRRFGEMGLAALLEGLAEFLPQDVSPLSRYELDNIIGVFADEHADEVVGPEALEAEWTKAYDEYPDFYSCDECGGEVS